MIAFLISSSTEQTNKVSFKAAGVKYKEHFIVSEILSVPDEPNDQKTRYFLPPSSSQLGNDRSQNSTNKFSFVEETEQVKKSTNSTLNIAEKLSVVKENMETSSDLQVLSSFDCVKSIPSVLLDYISTMFLNEYGRSHKDFHSKQSIDETLPLLKQFNINCGIDQDCSTLFQYDKKYGLHTSADKTFKPKELFYCCPSVHSLTNATISDVCKRANTVAQKTIFRESKDSTFLGRVKEISYHVLAF